MNSYTAVQNGSVSVRDRLRKAINIQHEYDISYGLGRKYNADKRNKRKQYFEDEKAAAKNKWNSIQQHNMDVINSNDEIKLYLEQARKGKINSDAAQQSASNALNMLRKTGISRIMQKS